VTGPSSAAPARSADAVPAGSGSAAPTGSGNAAPTGSGNAAPTGSGNAAPAGSGNAAPAGSGNAAPAGSAGAAERVIGSYLAEVADRLIGPARARRGILTELGAGLEDAADAYRSAGLAPGEAVRAAITEFGHPGQVADGFRAELTAAQARRTALTLLRTGPFVGLLWLSAALASRIGAQVASPWHWASMPIGARIITHLAGIAFALAIGGALVTVAATGRLTRWLPAGPGSLPVRSGSLPVRSGSLPVRSRWLPAHSRWLPAWPAASAAIAAIGTAAIDIALLALLVTQVISAPGRLAALPVAVAATASLTRLTLTTRAARNCLTTSVACLSSVTGA
jgi:hypothetical protein